MRVRVRVSPKNDLKAYPQVLLEHDGWTASEEFGSTEGVGRAANHEQTGFRVHIDANPTDLRAVLTSRVVDTLFK